MNWEAALSTWTQTEEDMLADKLIADEVLTGANHIDGASEALYVESQPGDFVTLVRKFGDVFVESSRVQPLPQLEMMTTPSCSICPRGSMYKDTIINPHTQMILRL